MKFVTFINPKVCKVVVLCDSNYATNKEIIKIVSGIVATLIRTLLTYSLRNQRIITMSSIEAKYLALLVCV